MREYYSLSRTLRAQALGNAFYGLSDDEGAVFYNPAGLAFFNVVQFLPITVTAAASSSAPSAFGKIRELMDDNDGLTEIVGHSSDLQGKILSAEGGVFSHYARKGFAIGLLLADTKVNALLTGREIDTELDLTAISDTGLFLTKAWQMGKSPFYVGLTTKLLARAGGHVTLDGLIFLNDISLDFEDLGGFGLGADFDLGVVWSPKGTSGFGISVNNVLASEFPWMRIGAVPPPGLPRMLSFGAFWTVGRFVWRVDLSELSLGGQSDSDLGARDGSFFKHLNAGVEWKLSHGFQLRAGLHQGAFCAGFGLTAPFARLDLATWGEELGMNPGTLSSRRYGLRLALGYVSSSGK